MKRFVIFIMMVVMSCGVLPVMAAESTLQKMHNIESNVIGKTSIKIYGGIEIGAKGVKAIVFEKTESDDDELLSLSEVKRYTKNTTIVSGMKDGNFSQEAVAETAQAVKDIYEQMKGSYSPKVIVCAASSAVAKGKNKDELALRVKDLTGLELAFFDVKKEVYYGLASTIPLRNWRNSVLVDIGSGNTKIGYMEHLDKNDDIVYFEVPYGSVSLSDKAAKGDDFVSEIDKIVNEDILSTLKSQAERKPALLSRKRIYVIGGASWAAANFSHPELINKRIVRITYPNIIKYRKGLIQKENDYAPKISNLSAANSEKAAKELAKIRDVFTNNNLIAGSSILKATAESFNRKKKGYFIFPREGAGWIAGYALSKEAALQENK